MNQEQSTAILEIKRWTKMLASAIRRTEHGDHTAHLEGRALDNVRYWLSDLEECL